MCARIKYEHFDELPQLIADRIITARPHPALPLNIYNYTVKAAMTPMLEWTSAMMDCRGLILDVDGYIVGRPFQKFWNYSQVMAFIPTDDFTVWEKLDGSMGIICGYGGQLVVATRGSFESDQALWLDSWVRRKIPDLSPSGETYIVEIIYPANRIVVDYGKREDAVLLAVMAPDGVEMESLFSSTKRFTKARRFDGVKDFSIINSDPQFAGEEGFVVKWKSGLMAKVKADEYCRLHRLITQCSTRTIWELLRAGSVVDEIVDRVPVEFANWVHGVSRQLSFNHSSMADGARTLFWSRNASWSRKEFAEWAKVQQHPQLLFALLDGKPIIEMCWGLVEPKWSTPFRKERDEE